MKSWKRKILHRHNSGTIVLPGNIMDAAGFDDVPEVMIEVVSGGIMIRPLKPGVLMIVGGENCFTWQDVEYMAGKMREKEAAEKAAEREGVEESDDFS